MRKTNHLIFSILILGILGGVIYLTLTRLRPPESLPAGESWREVVPSGCSVFTVSKGEQVFFSGNDDSINPDSYYWVDPGGAGVYGAIWIGTPDNVQQGVNQVGLAYDANGLPRVDTHPHLEREPVYGDYSSYPIYILQECATVAEVIAWVNTHQWHAYMHDQMHFADPTGDAVIISAGLDGEVVFTRKPPGDSFLVSTNFNVANPANGYGYPSSNYDTATERLDELLAEDKQLTAQDAARVLDAIHEQGSSSWTIESLVADLPNGIVYLYYFYQFDKPVVLNVAEEIAKARSGGPLSRLFPEEVQQEAAYRYQRIQAHRDQNQVIGKVWLGLVLASLLVLLIGLIRQPQGSILWIPLVFILGPLGLLVWLACRHRHKAGSWQAILVEAAGDVVPAVIAFMIFLVVGFFIPAVQASQGSQVLLIFGLPVVLGWLVFQGPWLALAGHKSYFATLLQRLPHTWVAANLGIACIFALAMPLVNMSLQLPLPPWNVVAWWAFTVLSAVVAMLLLFLYEGWCLRRGYQAWTVLAWAQGEVRSAPWRKLWWWILLSYAVVIGGIVVYRILEQLLST